MGTLQTSMNCELCPYMLVCWGQDAHFRYSSAVCPRCGCTTVAVSILNDPAAEKKTKSSDYLVIHCNSDVHGLIDVITRDPDHYVCPVCNPTLVYSPWTIQHLEFDGVTTISHKKWQLRLSRKQPLRDRKNHESAV